MRVSLPPGPRWRRSRGAVPHAADQRDLTREREPERRERRAEGEKHQKQSKPARSTSSTRSHVSLHTHTLVIALSVGFILYCQHY
jgi:hypothetical protein